MYINVESINMYIHTSVHGMYIYPNTTRIEMYKYILHLQTCIEFHHLTIKTFVVYLRKISKER